MTSSLALVPWSPSSSPRPPAQAGVAQLHGLLHPSSEGGDDGEQKCGTTMEGLRLRENESETEFSALPTRT
jgi:hypothetical protein